MRASQDRPEAGRIVVYGVTGSGKSVLAARISELTGIAHLAVDDICWRPGWVQVSPDEQRRLMRDVCSRERWVLDSAWGQTLSRESIIAWHVRSFASKRRRIAEWEADPDRPPVLRLRSTRDTEEWLAGLVSSTTTGGAT